LMYGRGTVDEKGSTPPMIYGLKIAHDLGLLDGFTAYYFGSIEEWCEGLSAQVFAEEERVRPDFVVIDEPTNSRVYRGQKGRYEMRVTARGRSAHGASHVPKPKAKPSISGGVASGVLAVATHCVRRLRRLGRAHRSRDYSS